ncbi:protein kinase [Streptomyces sp. p1417]|uniref:Protein kinase n=1 Tax=Streptomyces typhae TaxID=2681492 RepID=A0A6L6WZE8_9ACTN|nr:serine/threonine-protein kinase [Streptomyces typhae]MVO86883.1 protein kinase [Streptomyces typhae]
MAGATRGTPVEVGGYRLVAQLGAGGMGRVHLARSASGRPVAVKTVHGHLAAEPEFRERFRRETAAARAVTGPYTAAVLDADPDAEQPWLVTEFCAGPLLADAVAAHGPLSAADLAVLGASLAEALAAVHAAGIVHRDLKPSNVVVTRDGPKVLDFGIAQSAVDDSLTASDEAIGSPGFIAPEQLTRAEGDGRAGPPADVFALGALLALAATGRAPFGADGVARVLYRTLHEPPDLVGVPSPALGAFLARCLSRAPADRPTVAEVLLWCGERASDGPAPWWERGAVADLIGRHELGVAELWGVDDLSGVDGDARHVPEEDPPPSPGPSRRRLLRWGGGTLLAAAGAAGAAVTLGDGGMGGKAPRAGRKKRVKGPPQGQVMWRQDVGELRPGGTGLRFDGNKLHLLGPSSLTCLEARFGTTLWVYSADRLRDVSSHDGTVYVLRDSPSGPELNALDANAGRKTWTSPFPAHHPVRRATTRPRSFDADAAADAAGVLEGDRSMLVPAGDVICLLTYASYDTLAARRGAWGRRWRAYGYDARTREALWFHEGTAAGVIGVDTEGGRIAVAVSADPGGAPFDERYARGDPLVVLRAKDGTVERTVRGGAPYPRAHPGAWGTACYASRTAIRAVDLTSGRVRWTRGMDAAATVTPRATYDMFLAATPKGLGAYGVTRGQLRWHRDDVRALTDSDGWLLSSGSAVYVSGPEPGTSSGEPDWGLHALDVRTGDTEWVMPYDIRSIRAATATPGPVHLYAEKSVVAIVPPEPL